MTKRKMPKGWQSVTIKLNQDNTVSMRSTGGFDLRQILSPEAKAQLEEAPTPQPTED